MQKPTGQQTESGFGEGIKLYQRQAKAAMPFLVRQAMADGTPMYYSDLAALLGVKNKQHLRHVLGAIGNEIEKLAAKWGEDIPPLSCIVINKSEGLPGKGIGWFIDDEEAFGEKPLEEKRRIFKRELTRISDYKRWADVLKAFNLEELPPISEAELRQAGSRGAAGEGQRHRELKNFVASHPELLNLPKKSGALTEYLLASADRIDVLFQTPESWVGVEVKSRVSELSDLTRGIFQCVKYRALLSAEQRAMHLEAGVRVLLVVEEPLPIKLEPLRLLLGVEVAIVSMSS